MNFLIVGLCLALPAMAQAQSYPEYSELYVNDFASLLSTEEAAAVRADLQELRNRKGIEFTVVTLRRMSDYGHSGAIEPFATGLFNYWGIGDATRNDGMMMLVAVEDRVMRLEVGAGYGRSKDDAMAGIIDSVMIPHFRDDDYAKGIMRGVEAVIFDLTGSYPGEYDAGFGQRAVNRIQRALGWLGDWIFALIMPFLAIPVVLYRRWRRNRPRICPIDGLTMYRLTEEKDDSHLDQGQRTEERLQSIDYDVWQCPDCAHVTVESYRAWFSGYGACRNCQYRTLEGDTTILEHASTSSTGLKRIDYHCHHCGEEYSVTRVIPKKSKSSSSSGGFGGGSSSGGGASGSW